MKCWKIQKIRNIT